jgi:hypothetical protein
MLAFSIPMDVQGHPTRTQVDGDRDERSLHHDLVRQVPLALPNRALKRTIQLRRTRTSTFRYPKSLFLDRMPLLAGVVEQVVVRKHDLHANDPPHQDLFLPRRNASFPPQAQVGEHDDPRGRLAIPGVEVETMAGYEDSRRYMIDRTRTLWKAPNFVWLVNFLLQLNFILGRVVLPTCVRTKFTYRPMSGRMRSWSQRRIRASDQVLSIR